MKCRNSYRNPWWASTLQHWSLLTVISMAYSPTCVCHLVPFSVHIAPPFIHSPPSLWGLTLRLLPHILFTCTRILLTTPPSLTFYPRIFPKSVWETKFLHYLSQFLKKKNIFLLEISWNNSWSFFYYSMKFKQTLAEFFRGLAQLLWAVWVMGKLPESFLDT